MGIREEDPKEEHILQNFPIKDLENRRGALSGSASLEGEQRLAQIQLRASTPTTTEAASAIEGVEGALRRLQRTVGGVQEQLFSKHRRQRASVTTRGVLTSSTRHPT